MRTSAFDPCIPTRGIKVPDRPEWIHEIKHDGYRLIIQREGKRVRLFTRNGYDWSHRYPLIVEAALRIRQSSFVIDGEAVLLGVDGRSDFDGLHSRQHDEEVQFYAFDMLVNSTEAKPAPHGTLLRAIARPVDIGDMPAPLPWPGARHEAKNTSIKYIASAERLRKRDRRSAERAN
jgi:hypothetical protein